MLKMYAYVGRGFLVGSGRFGPCKTGSCWDFCKYCSF